MGDVPGGSIVPNDDQVDGEGMVKVPLVLFCGGCACSGLGGCGQCLGSLCTGSGMFEGRFGTGPGVVDTAVSFGVSVSSLASDSLSGDGEGPAKVSKKAESRKLDPI